MSGKDDSRDGPPWRDPSRPIIGNRPEDADTAEDGEPPGDASRSATSRPAPRRGSSPDPVLFGPDPFDEQPGWRPPAGDTDDTDGPPRPRWPVIVLILVVVVVVVAAMGIWV